MRYEIPTNSALFKRLTSIANKLRDQSGRDHGRISKTFYNRSNGKNQLDLFKVEVSTKNLLSLVFNGNLGKYYTHIELKYGMLTVRQAPIDSVRCSSMLLEDKEACKVLKKVLDKHFPQPIEIKAI